MEQRELTIKEASERPTMPYTYDTLRQKVHYGKVKSIKRGKNRMIPMSEVEKIEAEGGA